MSRYVNLDEKVTAQFYDQECEEWTMQTVTIADVLDSVCDDYTVIPSAKPDLQQICNQLANDCISRKATIDLLWKRLIETANNNVGFTCDAGEVFEDASERIKYWIDELPPAQPKKLPTLSERKKIITAFKKWCLINNVDGCEESFLDYLCLMEYIHG